MWKLKRRCAKSRVGRTAGHPVPASDRQAVCAEERARHAPTRCQRLRYRYIYQYLIDLFKALPLVQTVDDYEALRPWKPGKPARKPKT
ncbi:MAG: transposase domain-containing protein [Burkholderia sp.]